MAPLGPPVSGTRSHKQQSYSSGGYSTPSSSITVTHRHVYTSSACSSCGDDCSSNSYTNRTNISMENVANHSLHLHLRHMAINSARQNNGDAQTKDLDDIMDSDGEDNEEMDGGEADTNLRTTISKMLASTDSEDSRALRRAANIFAQLATGKPFITEDSAENTLAPKIDRTFTTGDRSPWNNAVQNVVDSVHGMAQCATSILHDNALLPRFTASPSSSSGFLQLPAPIKTTPRDYRSLQDNRGAATDSADMVVDKPDVSTAGGLPKHAPEEDPNLDGMPPIPPHSIQVPKEHVMTVCPLLMPPEDRLIPAHRLASLYFTAIVDSCNIPEFRADYVYSNARPTSILLTFKNIYDADRLKEIWDSADRGNTTAPGLAQVSLHRGNVSANPADTSVRNTALHELSFFSLTPYAIPMSTDLSPLQPVVQTNLGENSPSRASPPPTLPNESAGPGRQKRKHRKHSKPHKHSKPRKHNKRGRKGKQRFNINQDDREGANE